MSTKTTPMMAQYHALKAEADGCLLFYRMGDFFELFFDDARQAAGVLDIALTSRGEHGGEAVPMCGVPVHAANAYLAKLIKAGCRVAIAEQVETPEEAKKRGGSKALVRRDIVRFVTAGTLTEDALLEPRAANVLAAICEVRGRIGMAACDISTGAMELSSFEADALLAEIARIGPSELIAPEGEFGAEFDAIERRGGDFSSDAGERRLTSLHGTADLESFGTFDRPMLAAAGGLLAYLEHVGRGTLPFLLPPVARAENAHMAMDDATRASLEILSAQGGGRAGSLIGAIDRCVTAAGARQLAEDLSAPLMDRLAIEARLDLVQFFQSQSLIREDVRAMLRKIPDLARALGRAVAGRASPRDLGQIRDALAEAISIRDYLAPQSPRPALLERLLPALSGHGALLTHLKRALVAAPPTEKQNGGYIAEGYDAALDELRAISGNARRAIAALEAQYREETGVNTLKIKHNGVLGYFIEVGARHGDALMAPDSGFTHRQTMKDAVRFNSVRLHEQAGRINEAGAHALAIEEEHFAALNAELCAARLSLAETAAALGRIDVAASHAARSTEGDWAKPEIDEGMGLEITLGRHPVVEDALHKSGARFVANDLALTSDDRLWLIGGPNMGGKSTFLRQNALIVLLAQAGSFVPAKSAKIGLVDRLFSRVGASDNLARGRSTFMVEMVETAAILNQASERSFVILDEVGRGTSTYDGLALAWAVAEAVHENNKCRCLFATHYHEMARLAQSLPALSLHHVRAKEWKGSLVLLHEVAGGPADKSYGLAVAKLAGVPAGVVARAKAVLAKLEAGKAANGGIAAGLGELPLFATYQAEEPAPKDDLRNKIRDLDVDALTPKAALELLYELKNCAAEEH